MNLRLPAIRIAEAIKTGFKDKHFDVLIDAGSLQFILDSYAIPLMQRGIRVRKEDHVNKMIEVLSEYKRVSKKVILIYRSNYSLLPQLMKALSELGASFNTLTVRNEYRLKLNGFGRIMKHWHDYDRALIASF